jgi:Flp pilus assembly protein protease CpaA
MNEVLFLFILGLVWILFATIQDIKKREIADWLSFSLIIFAIGFRFFYSLFEGNFSFFYSGLIGLGIFFIIGNVFYYGRLFAGGDAKLMIAMGVLLPFSFSFYSNLFSFFSFLVLFLVSGSIYSMIFSVSLSGKYFKKFKPEFKKQFKKFKKKILLFTFLAIVLAGFGFLNNSLFFFFGLIVFILPYLYVYAKAIDESVMVAQISPKNLQEGDWLYKNVKVGGKNIKTSWGGITREQISFLKKNNKKVYVRQGIPFVPTFLISYLIYFLFFVF